MRFQKIHHSEKVSMEKKYSCFNCDHCWKVKEQHKAVTERFIEYNGYRIDEKSFAQICSIDDTIPLMWDIDEARTSSCSKHTELQEQTTELFNILSEGE